MTKKELKKKYEDEIMELKKDIRILVEEKDFVKLQEVKFLWRFRFNASDMAWGKPIAREQCKCGKIKLLGVECRNPNNGQCEIDLINARFDNSFLY